MKKIITINIYLIDEQTIDHITYFDNSVNKEIEIKEDYLIHYFEEFWLDDLSLIHQRQSVNYLIDGKYLICENCGQNINIEKTYDELHLEQLCESFDEIHKNCGYDLLIKN